MPHLIVSTVALLSSLYRNAPLIVGDKDSDPELMRFLGARLTTSYPACGSPPMYVIHATPRTVFDNLEKRGYCIMSAQTIQEHSVWILARPRVPDDDKVEIARGGPNDKSVQAFDDADGSPPSTPSGSKKRSPNRAPRVKITRSPSRQSFKEKDTLKVPSRNYPLIYEESSVNRKLSLMEIHDLNDEHTGPVSIDRSSREKNTNRPMLSVQLRKSPPTRKTSRKKKKSLPNKLRFNAQVKENSSARNLSSSIVIDNEPLIETGASRSRSISPEIRHTSTYDFNTLGDPLEQVMKRMPSHNEEKKSSCTKICTDNKPSHSRSESSEKKYNAVTSKGDAGTYWLGNEKVHMGIQASDSEVSLKRDSDVMTRVAFNSRNHTDLLKRSVESIEDPKRKSALKSTMRLSKQVQTNSGKTSLSVHFENAKDGLNIEKPFALHSSIYELPRIVNLPWEGKEKFVTSSDIDEGSHFLKVEESTKINEANVFKDSVILRSLASRCSHIKIVDDEDADTPVFIDITDPTHLTCLTHDSCCCEDS